MAGSTLDKWIDQMSDFLVKSWGLDVGFASNVALLYLYFVQYSLNPQITSGYRDPVYQKSLIDRYNAGDKSIVVKPAEASKHSALKMGKPASLAIDISTKNHLLAAQIARYLKIGTGYDFKNSDPVHFYI